MGEHLIGEDVTFPGPYNEELLVWGGLQCNGSGNCSCDIQWCYITPQTGFKFAPSDLPHDEGFQLKRIQHQRKVKKSNRFL